MAKHDGFSLIILVHSQFYPHSAPIRLHGCFVIAHIYAYLSKCIQRKAHATPDIVINWCVLLFFWYAPSSFSCCVLIIVSLWKLVTLNGASSSLFTFCAMPHSRYKGKKKKDVQISVGLQKRQQRWRWWWWRQRDNKQALVLFIVWLFLLSDKRDYIARCSDVVYTIESTFIVIIWHFWCREEQKKNEKKRSDNEQKKYEKIRQMELLFSDIIIAGYCLCKWNDIVWLYAAFVTTKVQCTQCTSIRPMMHFVGVLHSNNYKHVLNRLFALTSYTQHFILASFEHIRISKTLRFSFRLSLSLSLRSKIKILWPEKVHTLTASLATTSISNCSVGCMRSNCSIKSIFLWFDGVWFISQQCRVFVCVSCSIIW